MTEDTYFNGTIDNVQIYATSITADGIASLATAAPTIATAAAASPSPVTGTTAAALRSWEADDGGAVGVDLYLGHHGHAAGRGRLFGQRHERRPGDDRRPSLRPGSITSR